MTRSALSGLRLLLVEDEFMIAMLIEDILLELGCVVIGPFASLPEALHAAQHAALDGALLDVNLRGEKVYPVAQVLDGRDIPFLLLSGYGSDAIPADRPDWRACSKPFNPSELIEMLTERITRRV